MWRRVLRWLFGGRDGGWRDVERGEILPVGSHVRMNVSTGRSQVKMSFEV